MHDEFAGRGVGKALMTALVDLADNWIGLMRVELEAFADNERAIAMYRHFGFVEEGRQQQGLLQRRQPTSTRVLMARVR